MEFTLYYRGDLKSNGSPQEKHRIRMAFHPQLEYLWSLSPLDEYEQFRKPLSDDPSISNWRISLLEEIGGVVFAPLISAKIYLNAELVITFLRPEKPGGIIQQYGDIDNRLKTLFDALAVPAHANQLSKTETITGDHTPIFCLLQDDKLISSVHVKTDRLLDITNSDKEVVLLVHVKTKITRHVTINGSFI